MPNARLLDGGWIASGGGWATEPAAVPPDEIYLRLARDTDLGDPDALLDVVRTVGGISGLPARDFVSQDFYEIGWQRLAAHRGLPLGLERPRLGLFHVAELAWRLRVLDICGRVVVAYRQGDYVAPVWIEQMLPEPRKELMKLGKAAREQRVWQDWMGYMNPALRRWHVRPIISGPSFGTLDEGEPTLLEAGALQIMNDLVREADYHPCANETCGRIFARQVGGSGDVFNRRTGVKYCSMSCKNSQQQREHRRRQKARKEGQSS